MDIRRLSNNIAAVCDLIDGRLSQVDRMVIAYRLDLLTFEEFRDYVFLYKLDLELLH